ncbi:MAG: 2Fe-2S iron-sulfur cluster binding domain-containing protein [Leptolyngbyaceae cyanobacterium SL_7_1]|nr:2Fe-2S iron-sulfur cluster binding domain-containing protein [Leptolyngbyaceae cyanobacterium SL_7_1]
MLESLGRIQNPVARSLAAAVTVGSVVAMTAGVVLGVGSAKDNAAHRAAVYASLVGIGCGAVFGLLYPAKASPLPSTSTQSPPSLEQGDRPVWKNWRNFVVVGKVKESEEITSFYLQPEDQGAIPNFQPGQFLTIKLDIPGQTSPVIRTYSLSDYAEPCQQYRLSIKREPMPAGTTFMPGIASNFMHDQVHEGTVIAAKPPSGKFVLDVHQPLPAVLISNGVGITPMISMAKAVALNPTRSIYFVHGARSGDFHAFRDEVKAIAQQNSTMQVHFAYSRPELEDDGHYHSTGYVNTDLIRSLIQQDAEYFLCGSPAFMQSLREGLQVAGVPENRVFFEAFTKGVPQPTEARAVASNGAIDHAEVMFAASGHTASWQSSDGNLLEFAEANDLQPDHSCRQGICGTCMCRILEGEVEYETTPVAAIDEGSALICISRPKTHRLVLDL